MHSCCMGPGYASPLDAMRSGERETLIYLPCLPVASPEKPEYLATVDIDPVSPDYCKVIHRLPLGSGREELHHMGWNACSSCYKDGSKSRSKLIIPALVSSTVYIVDTKTNPRAPTLHKALLGDEVKLKTGLGYPHTSHCLGSGEIMISMMGDTTGESRGNFVLLDEKFEIKGVWSSDHSTPFGYDFWYQPRHNIMVSTEYGRPKSFLKCFDPSEVENHYGSSLHFWNWKERQFLKSIDMKPKGMIPLEVRFLHDPNSSFGFVGFALTSNVGLIYKNEDGEWDVKIVIEQESVKLEGWALAEMPPLTTDILISLDDKYLYFSNFLRGDICQYDITDPHHPVLVGRIWCGGAITKDKPIKIISGLPDGLKEIEAPVLKGKKLTGGPQMLQLSLDGKRLYSTNSLLSSWDKQFYPELIQSGSYIIQIDVNTDKGGLKFNEDFYVGFGDEPHGSALAHEIRFPGGDCSSDIWI
eukprot:g3237.t1